MDNGQIRTASEVLRFLDSRREKIRSWFNHEVAQLEAETRSQLEQAPEKEEDICIEATRKYMRLLGKAHRNQRLLGELVFLIRRRWHGWPIVEVWDGAGIPRDEWELIARICVAPEGRLWEAREAASIDQETIDEAGRIVYYMETEPYQQLATAA